MERRISYKIDEQHDGKCVGEFLKEREFSRSVLIELKKTETGITKNGIWTKVNEVLQAGDVLEICLLEEEICDNIVPKEYPLEILYEDEDILVVNKPYDTPIHPSINNYDNTLANGVMGYYQKQGQPHVFRCINRLDRDTTGVTIMAKNLLSAGILSNKVKERSLSRIYVALVEGIVEKEGTISLPIGRVEGSIIKRQVDEVSGKQAVTHYRRLDSLHIEGQAVSVVALKLETGRTHQIRVHMSAIGHPLLGDFLYNADNHMLGRQALHGAMCSFYHPVTGVYMEIMAPLFEDMVELIGSSDEVDGSVYALKAKIKALKW